MMVWKMCLFLDTAILGIYVQFQGGYTASPMVSFEKNIYII